MITPLLVILIALFITHFPKSNHLPNPPNQFQNIATPNFTYIYITPTFFSLINSIQFNLHFLTKHSQSDFLISCHKLKQIQPSVAPTMASVLASSSRAFCDSLDVSADFALDFSAKLRIEEPDLNNADEQEEFSFVCGDLSQTLASADELFHNGQIRPKFPLFVEEYDGASPLQPPLKKLFVERRDISSPALADSESVEWKRVPPAGSYCRWKNKKTKEVLNQRCEKSNSTGFSKLWRFRDLKLRSNSDGKDAFVFLTASSAKKRTSSEKAANVNGTTEKASSGKVKNDAVTKSKSETALWGPEKHYVMIRARKESDKRRSYLPYKQDLVGFFTNVNGFSRNVHPF